MPAAARRRGARRLSRTPDGPGPGDRDTVEFRILGLEVAVHAADPRAAQALDMLVQRARWAGPPAGRAEYAITGTAGAYAVFEDGLAVDSEVHPAAAVERVSERAYRRALALLAPDGLVKGALGLAGDRRLLIVPDDPATTTLLAIRLLYDGVAMEGAHLVALAGAGATAVPQPLYLLEDPGAALPELSRRYDELPLAEVEGGHEIRAFHPDAAGFDWCITTGPVDLVIDLQTGHGAASRLTPVARYEMARVVGSRCLAPASPSRWAAALARLVDGADCRRLTLGRLEDAVRALDPALR